MPQDREAWRKKIDFVQRTIGSQPSTNHEGLYFLVMEDQESGEIIGTASVHTGVGHSRPFYNYKLSKHVKTSQELGVTVTVNTLNLVNDFTGKTEFESLFLNPKYRGASNGRFLSQSRFAMMNDFPERFTESVFAEIRGWLDEQGESPFWKHLGSKFFKLSYCEADSFSAIRGSQFISDLMPKHPVYLELLPDEAVEVIGKPHRDAKSAMSYLLQEGFRYQGAVDVFDAGPVVECDREHMRSKTLSVSNQVIEFTSRPLEGDQFIVSNGDLQNYRLTLTPLENTGENTGENSGASGVVLPEFCREALGITEGSTIKVMPLL